MKGAFHIAVILLLFAVSAVYCLSLFGGFEGIGDGNDYAALARNIVSGRGLSLGHVYPLALAFNWNIPQPNNIWAPGYPVYLAFWFLLFGANDTSAIMASIATIWLLIIAAYYLGRKIMGPGMAILTAVSVGLSQVVMYAAIEGTPELLAGALLVFSVLALGTEQRIGRVALSAVIFGLAVLTRYQIAIIAIPLLIIFLRKNLVPVWLAIFIMTLSPWLVRNWIYLGNPFFTLQSYGEFTKGMGRFDDYYFTYRSFTPHGFIDAIFQYPFDVAKKFVGGLIFFGEAFPIRFNFLGVVPFVFAVLRWNRLESLQKKLVLFSFVSAILIALLSSFDGHHDRHLLPLQAFFSAAMLVGFGLILSELRLRERRLFAAILLLILFLPARAPYQELGLSMTAHECRENIPGYLHLTSFVDRDDVVVSDASDAVWWYADRLSIWSPVQYDDLKMLMSKGRCDYVYFAEPMEFLNKTGDEDLADFVSSAEPIAEFPGPGQLFKVIEEMMPSEDFAADVR